MNPIRTRLKPIPGAKSLPAPGRKLWLRSPNSDNVLTAEDAVIPESTIDSGYLIPENIRPYVSNNPFWDTTRTAQEILELSGINEDNILFGKKGLAIYTLGLSSVIRTKGLKYLGTLT